MAHKEKGTTGGKNQYVAKSQAINPLTATALQKSSLLKSLAATKSRLKIERKVNREQSD